MLTEHSSLHFPEPLRSKIVYQAQKDWIDSSRDSLVIGQCSQCWLSYYAHNPADLARKSSVGLSEAVQLSGILSAIRLLQSFRKLNVCRLWYSGMPISCLTKDVSIYIRTRSKIPPVISVFLNSI